MKKEKLILDACCGGRMMWFNKKHPNAIYIDNRKMAVGGIEGHPNFKVDPDMVMDFRKMKFKDESFSLVVFDPPHLTSLSKSSWMAKKYGILDESNWKEYIKQGFDECWRVLKPNGVLIFKWSEAESSKSRSKTVTQVLEVIGREPLFGHKSGKTSKTHWLTFMKLK